MIDETNKEDKQIDNRRHNIDLMYETDWLCSKMTPTDPPTKPTESREQRERKQESYEWLCKNWNNGELKR